MEKVAKQQVPRPSVWRDNDYPPRTKDERNWTIPEDDEQYIKFIYYVDRRIPKSDANYPREQVKVLRQIRDGFQEERAKGKK